MVSYFLTLIDRADNSHVQPCELYSQSGPVLQALQRLGRYRIWLPPRR
jgi:hypothetical protein